MPKLPLPLHCYNEAGRVTPSSWFNLVFLWGARALFILIASFMIGPQGDKIPSLFFPLNWHLTAHCILGFLYIALWLLVGQREKFWQKQRFSYGIKTLLLLLLAIDIAIQGWAIASTQGQFNMMRGMMLLVTIFAAGYVLRSRRTRLMFRDWRTPDV